MAERAWSSNAYLRPGPLAAEYFGRPPPQVCRHSRSPAVHRHRAIFISDVHLGTRGCKAEMLSDFLARNTCDTLYLVGDIHRAEIRRIGPILYLNDGDWVESCTALVEDAHGHLEILRWASSPSASELARAFAGTQGEAALIPA